MTRIVAPRMAVLNLMPQAEVYPGYLAGVLPADTEVQWIRIRNHPYRSSDHAALAATHRYYEETDLDACDALLISGAPLDRQPAFEMAHYWNELTELLRDASTRAGSIAGVCWGALAVARIFYGLDKRVFERKLSGVYEMTNLVPDHPLMRGLDDRYWAPQSRYAQIDPDGLTALARTGELIPLDWAEETGHCAIVSRAGDFLLLQGHQDYPTERLAQEYRSARALGKAAPVPVNYDPERPVNRWRANSRALFAGWLRLAQERKRRQRHAPAVLSEALSQLA